MQSISVSAQIRDRVFDQVDQVDIPVPADSSIIQAQVAVGRYIRQQDSEADFPGRYEVVEVDIRVRIS